MYAFFGVLASEISENPYDNYELIVKLQIIALTMGVTM